MESAFTGTRFLDAFERNVNIAGGLIAASIAYAGAYGLVTGTSIYAGVGTSSIFQGYVKLTEPFLGIEWLRGGLTLGSGAVLSDDPSTKVKTWITAFLDEHELGHTIQFIALSAFGNPWESYLGLGVLGLLGPASNPWENLASLLGRAVP